MKIAAASINLLSSSLSSKGMLEEGPETLLRKAVGSLQQWGWALIEAGLCWDMQLQCSCNTILASDVDLTAFHSLCEKQLQQRSEKRVG